MSDETDKPDSDETEAEPKGPVAGERLAEARRENQISVDEIAKELHLDETKVRALERNEFDTLGAPVFAKGHLRKYAQLVGIDPDDVLADYYQLNRAVDMPPVVSKHRKPERELSPGPWIALVVVIILVAIAYWFFGIRSAPAPAAPSSEPDAPATQPVTQTAPAVEDSDDPAVGDETVADEPEPAAEPVVEEEAQPPVETAAIAPGQVRLEVTFDGDCWTEISDGRGQRLFFDLGRTGRTITLDGAAPLSVLFGNADNVSLRVNGRDYTVSPADRRGQTARLTLYGT